MAYTVIIRQQARKKLQSLERQVRVRIAEKIQRLGDDPDSPVLDTRKLEGESGWRLRVGGWRVLYERQDSLKVIAIEKIKSRGDVYK